jgi:hypothetical protein
VSPVAGWNFGGEKVSRRRWGVFSPPWKRLAGCGAFFRRRRSVSPVAGWNFGGEKVSHRRRGFFSAKKKEAQAEKKIIFPQLFSLRIVL